MAVEFASIRQSRCDEAFNGEEFFIIGTGGVRVPLKNDLLLHSALRTGRQAKEYSGKSSRKICAAWFRKERRVATAGAKRLRITQPLARFHSLASAGQPMCFVHLPFSVEYQ